jgi:hypothetical protein
MDCTGSMRLWMDEAKKTLIKLIDSIQEKVKGRTIRVAFIGYRDFDDSDI